MPSTVSCSDDRGKCIHTVIKSLCNSLYRLYLSHKHVTSFTVGHEPNTCTHRTKKESPFCLCTVFPFVTCLTLSQFIEVTVFTHSIFLVAVLLLRSPFSLHLRVCVECSLSSHINTLTTYQSRNDRTCLMRIKCLRPQRRKIPCV